MANLWIEPESREQPPATDAEHELLHETQIGASAVELARDTPVRGIVRDIVAVEQVKPHPPDLHLPGAQPDRMTRQIELQSQPVTVRPTQRHHRQLPRIVVRVHRLLPTIRVDDL